ncbi:uncharacterized protein LOC124455267 [Xenia sp. Carnegie-2017]|uniref:uncharacterized protein LOC124455267 n=1 Tax=Xenia sp. Carnegie-2017 TaxID=2897299 RepID=UPI001F0382A1|nr:uncharacterized protein LOC124455267 [Xenia sp. Carnegie-2017]
MFCSNCGRSCGDSDRFCTNCGTGMNSTILEDDVDEEREVSIDEQSLITYYFHRGFMYDEIILFLAKRHNTVMSYSTLLRRLKVYGLNRRGFFQRDESEETFHQAKRRISEMINGPQSSAGYRSIWHTLEMEGLRIPRVVVQDLLKELHPDGVEARKAHRLKRRVYHNPGPNYAWHIDGFDKLKPWGFPIHGAIDGFSRRILWLRVTRLNKCPDNIATFYLNTVKQLMGCPVKLITDLGTENAIVAAAQSYFRENPDSHRYVTMADIECISSSIVPNDVPNEYDEYFDYVSSELLLESPKDWSEAYQLYCKLMDVSKNGA